MAITLQAPVLLPIAELFLQILDKPTFIAIIPKFNYAFRITNDTEKSILILILALKFRANPHVW